jgi:hypothetical protein
MLESGMPSCQPFIRSGRRGQWLKEEEASAGLKPGAYIAEIAQLYPMAMKGLNKLLLRFDLGARLLDAALDEFRLHF